ncbi:integrase catalytic domain-containing protein [Nocardia sp. CA-107356]|uniref:integrase catalytic domain-containing protein n=1 Tax=Nocardia sp. CA-107356 TaxID=3239972 RepID=UPI003D919A86
MSAASAAAMSTRDARTYGPFKGVYYTLLVMLDIFSRKVIAWRVVPGESQWIAKQFQLDAIAANDGVVPDYIHADNGGPMTSKPVSELLIDLNITRKLDQARELLDTGADSDSAEFGAHYDEHTHLLRSASCYIEAGKPTRVADLYGTVLTTGTLSDRDEGYFRARHAVALALSGEPDSAADEGLLAMRRATEKQSARTMQELARAMEAMGRWQHRPGPRELREALAAHGTR